MLWEPKHCCCFKVKTGSLILGVFLLIGSLVYIGIDATTLADGSILNIVHSYCDDLDGSGKCDLFIKLAEGSVISGLVIGVCEVLVCSMLIYGILKHKTCLFIPFMVMLLLQIIMHMVLGLGLLAMAGIKQYWTQMFVFGVIFTLYIFLETFLLLVVRAHYLEVRRSQMLECLVTEKRIINAFEMIRRF
ncbi:lysosomal-associated transmembrane protein 4B-like [Procambarus clarkii]|uniref:lysosomal-associated transmembrane protein 4B n=1 Tax=Procambarus clarkii TaxID=6728 RepID=UPI001E67395D|nr:uncharacterized protein LOC123765629 [Procambarus clarkii]